MTDTKQTGGYGRVFKSVLFSPQLTPAQKGLYAYLSSYADSAGVAFPHQKKMCQDLSISEDTLRKYLKALAESKVLRIQKHISGNFYTLLPQTGGWGKVYKWVLTDPSIPLPSKGLYGILASFAGSDGIAHPHRGTLLKALQISKDSFYKYLHQLQQHQVLQVEARKEKARFTSSSFTFLPPPQKAPMEKPSAVPTDGPLPNENLPVQSTAPRFRPLPKNPIRPLMDTGNFFFPQKPRQENVVSQKREVPINKEFFKKTPSTIPRETSKAVIRPTDRKTDGFFEIRNELTAMENLAIPGVKPLSLEERWYIEQDLCFLESQCAVETWSYEALYERVFERLQCYQGDGFEPKKAPI